MLFNHTPSPPTLRPNVTNVNPYPVESFEYICILAYSRMHTHLLTHSIPLTRKLPFAMEYVCVCVCVCVCMYI